MSRSSRERVLRLFVNGRFVTKPPIGVTRVATELLRAADAELETRPDLRVSMELVIPPRAGYMSGLKMVSQRRVGRLSGNPWEQLSVALATRGRPLLNLAGPGPIAKRGQVILITDCGPVVEPRFYSRRFVLWYRFFLKRLAKRRALVLTNSAFVTHEVTTHLRVAADRIVTMPLGCDHIVRNASCLTPRIKETVGPRRPYLLAVGGWNARKNVSLAQRALENLRDLGLTLVIVGSNPAVITRSVNKTRDVVDLGNVSDEELRWLYENALCLVFPSLYEGFGIPPLEAMACGCPVIVSNRAALPETCADAALYCDAEAPDQLAELIRRIASDEPMRASLIARGEARAAMFTWARSAAILLGALEDAFSPAATAR